MALAMLEPAERQPPYDSALLGYPSPALRPCQVMKLKGCATDSARTVATGVKGTEGLEGSWAPGSTVCCLQPARAHASGMWNKSD